MTDAIWFVTDICKMIFWIVLAAGMITGAVYCVRREI